MPYHKGDTMKGNLIQELNAKDEERMTFFLTTLKYLQKEALTNPNQYIHNEYVDNTFTVWDIKSINTTSIEGYDHD